MEYLFPKKEITCLTCAARETQNQELNQEIKLNDGMPDIGRVIASWGQVIVRGKEWVPGAASMTGGIMVSVMYAPEDGSDLRSVDTWVPFQVHWNIPEVDRDGTLHVIPVLRFVDARTVSARKIMVRVGVAATAEALYPIEFATTHSDDLPEKVQVLENRYPINLIKEVGEKVFLVDEEIELSDGNEKSEKIIYYSVHPEISDKRIMTDKIVFRGTAVLHVLFKCENGTLHSKDFEMGYSQFAELSNSYGGDVSPRIQMAVTSLEMDHGGNGVFHLRCGFAAQYQIVGCELISLAEDAYSCDGDLNVRTESISFPVVFEEKQDQLVAEQIVSGVSGSVCDAMFLLDFPRISPSEHGASINCTGIFQTLYYDENGTIQCAVSHWEDTVSLPSSTDSKVTAFVSGCDSLKDIREIDGIDVKTKIQINMVTTGLFEKEMISGFEYEKREDEYDRPSVILCKVNAERLWDTAKRCKSTVEEIQKYNAQVQEPFDGSFVIVPVVH